MSSPISKRQRGGSPSPKNTLETGGEDVKNTLETSGNDFQQPKTGKHHLQVRGFSKESKNCTVFVKNLDWTVDEDKLYEIFCKTPGLIECRVVRDFKGHSKGWIIFTLVSSVLFTSSPLVSGVVFFKGFAYIDYSTAAQAQKAVEKFNNFELHKRQLMVAISKPTKDVYEK